MKTLTHMVSGPVVQPRRTNLLTAQINAYMTLVVMVMINSERFTLWINAHIPFYGIFPMLALLLLTPTFISWALRGELIVEKNGTSKVAETAANIGWAVLMVTGILGMWGAAATIIPMDHVWTGNHGRHFAVQNAVEDLQSNGAELPVELSNYNSSAEQLRNAYNFVDKIYDMDAYKRAMMSMTLLDLENDPVYLAGKENGWLSETQLDELGNRLRAKPPQVHTALQQQAYLRLVGEVHMSKPFPDFENG